MPKHHKKSKKDENTCDKHKYHKLCQMLSEDYRNLVDEVNNFKNQCATTNTDIKSVSDTLNCLKTQCDTSDLNMIQIGTRVATVETTLATNNANANAFTFMLNTMDYSYLLNNTKQFNVSATVTATATTVSITLPSFDFDIPTTGFVYNVTSSNLPQTMWHKRALPYAFNLPGDQSYVLYIFNDGSIVVGAPGFQPLMGGQHYTYGVTVAYSLDSTIQPPTNYQLHNKTANVTTTKYLGDFLDFYNNDFYDDTFAYCWSSNPVDEVTNELNMNLYAVVGTINNKGVPIFGPVKLLYAPDNQPLRQFCLENTISINPTNKQNIVVTTTYRNANIPIGDAKNPVFGYNGMIRSYTLNGGKTWQSDVITDTSFGLPPYRSDPNGLFDSFGNYWLCYMKASTADLQPPFELVFAVSTNGGATFTIAGQTTLNYYLDYPRLSFGGDGQGGKALWFSVDHVNDQKPNYVGEIIVGYIKVSGLSTYGTLTYGVAQGIGNDIATNSVSYIQVPEITVTPDGTVYLFAITQIKGSGSTTITRGDNGNYGKAVIYKHVGGINNFNFQPRNDVLMTNVGGNDFNTGAYGKPIPFQPNRGVFPIGARGIDYDPINNRIWVVSSNVKPNNFSPVIDTSVGAKYDMSIFTMYSDDGGVVWSPEIQISDRSTLPRSLPSIKVNQVNGKKAFFWYDCRDNTNLANVKPYGAFLN